MTFTTSLTQQLTKLKESPPMETMKRFSMESQTGSIKVDSSQGLGILSLTLINPNFVERIMKSRSAIWPSPKGSWLGYLKLNNSKVGSVLYPSFESLDILEEYFKIRYAKVALIISYSLNSELV